MWFKPADIGRTFVFVFDGNATGGLRASLLNEDQDIIVVQRPGGQVIRIAKTHIDRVEEYEGRGGSP
jgi:hypothetical protein